MIFDALVQHGTADEAVSFYAELVKQNKANSVFAHAYLMGKLNRRGCTLGTDLWTCD